MNTRKVIHKYESHSSTKLWIFPKGSSYSISQLFPNIEKKIHSSSKYIIYNTHTERYILHYSLHKLMFLSNKNVHRKVSLYSLTVKLGENVKKSYMHTYIYYTHSTHTHTRRQLHREKTYTFCSIFFS